MTDYNFDFNDAEPQMDFSLMPDNTFVKVFMIIRSDKEDALTDSKSSDAKYLDCELSVLEGKYQGRKFWENFVVSGGKQNDAGQSIAGNISRAKLRAILESARNIKATDSGKAAVTARRIKSFWDLNEIEFVVKLGIQKAKAGSGYDDKNRIKAVITPDMPEYKIVMSGKDIVVKIPKASVSTPAASWGQAKKETKLEPTPVVDDAPVMATADVPDWAQ
jgi:hypothetical protein